jgi:hypothetical protein
MTFCPGAKVGLCWASTTPLAQQSTAAAIKDDKITTFLTSTTFLRWARGDASVRT